MSYVIFIPLRLLGQAQQLLLNHRSHSFAGAHKLSVATRCLELFLSSTIFVPAIVGRVNARPGLSSQEVVDIGMLVMFLWQAFSLPCVPQTQGNEEEE
jgi:hypothetical protein